MPTKKSKKSSKKSSSTRVSNTRNSESLGDVTSTSTSISIATQTEPDDTNNDACNHEQQQIAALQLEIQQYKERVEILENELNVLKNKSSISNAPAAPLATATKPSDNQQPAKARSKKPSSPSRSAKASLQRGCACKGNCSGRNCGCVKKGVSCQQFCKCNDATCSNQEVEKENFHSLQSRLSGEGRKVLDRLGSLTLNQEVLHSSEKKSKRGIFSPSGDSRRRLFRPESEDLVDIECSSEQDSLASLKTNVNANNKTRPECSSLNFDSSLANCVREFKSRLQIDEVAPAPNLPKMSVTSESNQVVREAVTAKERPSFDPLSPNVYVAKRRYDRKVRDESILAQQRVDGSDDEVACSPAKDRNGGLGKDEGGEKETEAATKETEPTLDKRFASETRSNNFDDFDVNINPMVPRRQLPRSPIQTAGTPSVLDRVKQIDAEVKRKSLNPMMPIRQLPRSPESFGTPQKRFSSPKAELAVEEIDWERHQSELMLCTKCSRRFFPHRILKHRLICKGI